MINEPIIVEKKEKMTYKPIPENVYQVELLDIESRNEQTYNSKKKPLEPKEFEKVLGFQFTLLAGKDEDGSLRGRNLWENFVPTFLYEGKNGKNKLYQITEALLGRQLTPKDEAEMDTAFLNGLIGKQCRVGVKWKRSGDKIFSNIDTYFSIESELPKLTAEEKDNAVVKNKKESKEADKELDEVAGEEEIDESVVPF